MIEVCLKSRARNSQRLSIFGVARRLVADRYFLFVRLYFISGFILISLITCVRLIVLIIRSILVLISCVCLIVLAVGSILILVAGVVLIVRVCRGIGVSRI